VCILEQLGLCGILLVAVVARNSETFYEWLNNGWAPHHFLERHVHFSIIGCEMKDFFLGTITPVYIFHHIIAIVGCLFCLLHPVGAGVVTLLAIVAELGSGFCNVYYLDKASSTKFWGYILLMGGSNVAGVYMMWSHYWVLSLQYHVKMTYVVMASLLILLRTCGVLLELHTTTKSSKATNGAKIL